MQKFFPDMRISVTFWPPVYPARFADVQIDGRNYDTFFSVQGINL